MVGESRLLGGNGSGFLASNFRKFFRKFIWLNVRSLPLPSCIPRLDGPADGYPLAMVQRCAIATKQSATLHFEHGGDWKGATLHLSKLLPIVRHSPAPANNCNTRTCRACVAATLLLTLQMQGETNPPCARGGDMVSSGLQST